MNNMLGSLKIGTRLGVGFAFLLLLLCGVGAASIIQASHIYAGTEEIADNWLPSVQILGDIRETSDSVRRISLRSVLESEQTGKKLQRTRHDEELAKLESAMQAYQKLVSSTEEAQLNEKITKAWNDYIRLDRKLLELSESGEDSFAQARALAVGASSAAFREVAKLIDEDIKLNSRGAAAARAAADEVFKKTVFITCILIFVAFALSICIAVLLTRSITIPIGQAVSIAETVARGDLTTDIKTERRDEIGQLLQSLKAMNSKLSHVVSSIRTATESVFVASNQIATGNADLSSRTEEQAASLEQTAASMTELTDTVRQNAENAREANSLAISARESTATGRRDVEAMVETIDQVNADSVKVAEITGMIEGIAFQTNILALNAAVEAARAGEQGRGFAVVAGEVRTLAQRASAAAKEIKELIEVSTERVRQGAHRAGEASAAIGKIEHSISRVTDVIAEISAASEEQTRGIDQVHQAISQIDEVTQQNAALVEEAAAAAESMQEQAGKMKQEVMFFRLENQSYGVVGQAAQLSILKRQEVPDDGATFMSGKPRMKSRPTTAMIAANGHASASVDRTNWDSF